MSDKCAYPKCGKELIHVVGRRKKKYCNQKCNSAHWQKKNYVPSDKRPKFKRVPIEVWNKMTAEKEVKLQDANKTTGEVKPPEQPTTNYTVNTKAKENEPKEGSGAFYIKYGVGTWAEVKQLKQLK